MANKSDPSFLFSAWSKGKTFSVPPGDGFVLEMRMSVF